MDCWFLGHFPYDTNVLYLYLLRTWSKLEIISPKNFGLAIFMTLVQSKKFGVENMKFHGKLGRGYWSGCYIAKETHLTGLPISYGGRKHMVWQSEIAVL